MIIYRRIDRRRILREIFPAHSLVHSRSAGKQGIYINSAHSGTKQADSAENGEPAADPVGNHEERGAMGAELALEVLESCEGLEAQRRSGVAKEAVGGLLELAEVPGADLRAVEEELTVRGARARWRERPRSHADGEGGDE